MVPNGFLFFLQVVMHSYLGVFGRQVMPSQILGTVSTTGKQRALILVQSPAGNLFRTSVLPCLGPVQKSPW